MGEGNGLSVEDHSEKDTSCIDVLSSRYWYPVVEEECGGTGERMNHAAPLRGFIIRISLR